MRVSTITTIFFFFWRGSALTSHLPITRQKPAHHRYRTLRPYASKDGKKASSSEDDLQKQEGPSFRPVPGVLTAATAALLLASGRVSVPPSFWPYATSVTTIAGVVAFHEAGHLVASLAQGIKVTEFSVGVGPALFKWPPGKRSQSEGTGQPGSDDEDKDDERVQYALRLFPLGGFVSFPPHYNETNGPDDPTVEMYDDPDLLQNRPPQQRALVISAGVVANVVLAWACLGASISLYGLPQQTFQPGVVVSSVVDASGAGARAGLRPGDVITAIEGLGDSGSIGKAQSGVDATVAIIRGRSGLPTTLTVLRRAAAEASPSAAAIFPPTPPSGIAALEQSLSRLSLVVTPDAAPSLGGKGTVGVRLAPRVGRVARVLPHSAGELVKLTNLEFQRVWGDITGTLGAFGKSLLSGSGGGGGSSPAGPGSAGLRDLTGPLGVIASGAQVARTNGGEGLLSFAAVVSVNLAVINALPLPALDGGQLAFVVLEVLRGGRKLDVRTQENVQVVAILALLVLTVVATSGDLAGVGAAVVGR